MKKRFAILAELSGLLTLLFALFVPALASAAFTPTTTSYPTTSSYLTSSAPGPDGDMWYSSRAGGKIGKMAPDGTVTEYTPPSSDDSPSITAGPDGNMWFIEFNQDMIGKVTTSGSFTEYSIPTSGAGAYQIVSGPDGNLWFLENYGNKIGKITTSGSFTEYTIPTSSSNPQGLTVGADGNLWFTETSSSKIGKITTSGVITEYSVGSANPSNITAGTDGNLWFTTYNAHVGKITTSGTYTLYATSNWSSGITTGPDGLIWFTYVTGAYSIGSITTDGTVTNYLLPGSPYSLQMTNDTSNNLWLSVYESSGKLIKFTFPPKPTLAHSTLAANVISGKSVVVDVLSGATGNPDSTTLSIIREPSHGTAVDPPGTITYSPTAGYNGADSLTYKVCSADYNLMCAQGTLTFNVLAASVTSPETGYGKPGDHLWVTLFELSIASVGLITVTLVTKKYL
ncbi:MAG: Ig-like domain-containing protein [bacterium]